MLKRISTTLLLWCGITSVFAAYTPVSITLKNNTLFRAKLSISGNYIISGVTPNITQAPHGKKNHKYIYGNPQIYKIRVQIKQPSNYCEILDTDFHRFNQKTAEKLYDEISYHTIATYRNHADQSATYRITAHLITRFTPSSGLTNRHQSPMTGAEYWVCVHASNSNTQCNKVWYTSC